jgi:hypothetical protein
METDNEMTDVLRQDFVVLNETNRKGVIEMTKFLVLTQNKVVPSLLNEKILNNCMVLQNEEQETL